MSYSDFNDAKDIIFPHSTRRCKKRSMNTDMVSLLPVFSVPAGINETATIESPAMIIKATVVFLRPNLTEW